MYKSQVSKGKEGGELEAQSVTEVDRVQLTMSPGTGL